VFEVLSASTMLHDERTKVPEYHALSDVQDIVLIDPDTRRVRQTQRTGPHGWSDQSVETDTIQLASVGLSLLLDDIFAQD
jgi:Uma2 family endonuclease